MNEYTYFYQIIFRKIMRNQKQFFSKNFENRKNYLQSIAKV